MQACIGGREGRGRWLCCLCDKCCCLLDLITTQGANELLHQLLLHMLRSIAYTNLPAAGAPSQPATEHTHTHMCICTPPCVHHYVYTTMCTPLYVHHYVYTTTHTLPLSMLADWIKLAKLNTDKQLNLAKQTMSYHSKSVLCGRWLFCALAYCPPNEVGRLAKFIITTTPWQSWVESVGDYSRTHIVWSGEHAL